MEQELEEARMEKREAERTVWEFLKELMTKSKELASANEYDEPKLYALIEKLKKSVET